MICPTDSLLCSPAVPLPSPPRFFPEIDSDILDQFPLPEALSETDQSFEISRFAEVEIQEREDSRPGQNQAGPATDDFLLRLYLREALREPVLGDEEEKQVAWSAHFGDQSARERLVLGNLRLVVHIAWRYQGFGLALADLVNEGNLGLITASERFNPAFGVRFANYAGYWIRHRILRGLDNHGRTVRRPANFTRQLSAVRAAAEQLLAELGREPTDREVAAKSRLSLAVARKLREAGTDVSLDAPCHPDQDHCLADQLVDEQSLPPDEIQAQSSDRDLVADLLGTLALREQEVLRLRFGLDQGGPRTLEETGRALGLLRQRVHQLETGALKKLRQRINLDPAVKTNSGRKDAKP